VYLFAGTPCAFVEDLHSAASPIAGVWEGRLHGLGLKAITLQIRQDGGKSPAAPSSTF
jgi:hypothetical protein